MALKAKGNKITMDAYDFGQSIPFEISDIELTNNDTIVFEIRKSKDSGIILSKEYTNENGDGTSFRFFLDFTQKESSMLPPGNYVYYLRHLRNKTLRDTLITAEQFKVKDE